MPAMSSSSAGGQGSWSHDASFLKCTSHTCGADLQGLFRPSFYLPTSVLCVFLLPAPSPSSTRGHQGQMLQGGAAALPLRHLVHAILVGSTQSWLASPSSVWLPYSKTMPSSCHQPCLLLEACSMLRLEAGSTGQEGFAMRGSFKLYINFRICENFCEGHSRHSYVIF